MKRVALFVILAVALGMLIVPQAGSAANCRPRSPQPTPQTGSMQMPDGLGGTFWYHPSGSQVGIKGPHGYLVVQQNGSSADVYGHSNDANGLNGDVHLDSAQPSRVCIDTNGS